MDLGQLEPLVLAEIRTHANVLGLVRDAIRVRYVLNWGGFVNQSFEVGDGQLRFHLKLTELPERQEALRRWYRVNAILSARYRAPEVVSWLTIPGASHEGLLFRHVEGQPPPGWSRTLRVAVGSVIRRLHADRELAAAIFPDEIPPSSADGYRADFHSRFTEDLAFVAERPPVFVSPTTLAWMRAEVARLATAVAASAAFQTPASGLIHGDLWPDNLLLSSDARWYLLDWDELRLGDPIHDLAKLVDPGTADGPPPTPAEIAALVGDDPATRERLELYGRAIMLDWIIDPLADYVDADQAPEHAAAMRARKEREHRDALARYRERYAR